MPLFERARVEVYVPDLPAPHYRKSLSFQGRIVAAPWRSGRLGRELMPATLALLYSGEELEPKVSIIRFLGFPETFGVVLLTFSFVLLLAPYFSGADFGLFKIPRFTDLARKKLKLIGPIVFLGSGILFVPMIRQPVISNTNRSDSNARPDSNLATPKDPHTQVLQYLERARSLYGKAQYDEALEECDKALNLEPENQDALGLKTSINKTKEILNRNQ